MDLQPSHFVPVLKPKIDGTLPGHPTVAFCKNREIESSSPQNAGDSSQKKRSPVGFGVSKIPGVSTLDLPMGL
jgi:hypothetical protein